MGITSAFSATYCSISRYISCRLTASRSTAAAATIASSSTNSGALSILPNGAVNVRRIVIGSGDTQA